MQKTFCIFGFCPWHSPRFAAPCDDPAACATLEREYPGQPLGSEHTYPSQQIQRFLH